MAPNDATNRFSLLIVEDDKAALDLITRMVTTEFPDCTIYTAGNGKEGVEIFKQVNADVVMTDINMPEMNGIEMAREINSINPNTAYIVLTGYSDRQFYDDFNKIGFCAFLHKPLKFAELFDAVERCSAESRLTRGKLPGTPAVSG